MRLPIENGKRVTEDTFRWDGWEDNFHYDARCTVTGNCLVIDWTYDKSTDGKSPDTGKIVLTRQATPKRVEVAEEEQEETTTTAVTTKTETFNAEDELKALQGVWNVKDWTMVIRGDKLCSGNQRGYLKVVGKKGDTLLIDVILTDSMREGSVDRCIMRREGNTLHIHAARNKPRPTAFPDPNAEGYYRWQLWTGAAQ